AAAGVAVLPRRGIPQRDVAILRADHDGLAVGGDRDGLHGSLVGGAGRGDAALLVPDLHFVVLAARDDLFAVGGDGDAVDVALVPLQRRGLRGEGEDGDEGD